MNRLRLGPQARAHLSELVEDGYVSEAMHGAFRKYALTGKLYVREEPKPKPDLEIVPPRRFVSTGPLVVKQTMAYREGGLQAFAIPSLMAHGHQEYKTSLIG